jgi:hydrogenase-4 component B
LAQTTLAWVLVGTAVFAALLGALALARARLLAKRPIGEAVTWDCGYARPAPSMQYTASSFADPIVRLFAPFLGTRRELRAPEGCFPPHAALASDTPDLFTARLFTPAFAAMARALNAFRWLQHGGVHLYVLYVALTLVSLLLLALA